MEKLGSYFKVNDEGWGDRLLGLPVKHYELDKKCVGHVSGCRQRAFGAPAEPLLPWRETSW